MRRWRRAAGNDVLTAECTAFLEGRLAEHWERHGFVVPVWAWTNLLAHGTREVIAETVARRERGRRFARQWRVARSYMANVLLEVADGPRQLVALQTEVLIPLELEMATLPAVSRWSPRQWVDAVDWAIRSQPTRTEP
jgi:hypothetical protein